MKKSVALVPTNQVQVPSSTPNSNNNTEEEKYILDFVITSKGEIKLTSSQNRINNPPSIFYNNGKNIAFGGYWNGTIIVQNIDLNIDDKKIKTKKETLFYTGVNSPIVKIAIGKNETFVVCGNALGNIFFRIESKI